MLLLRICIVCTLLSETTKALIKIPPNETVPAVFAFGESIVDTGNNNNLQTLIKCNFPPYGRDFEGGIPTGRFCNGKVPADFLAQELGIKEDPNLSPSDLATGVCFASGGCGYDPFEGRQPAISLSQQLQHFQEYVTKLKGLVEEDKTKFILANSIFLIVAGSDDIANTYFTLRARQAQYDVPAYTHLMANSAAHFVQKLYALRGAKNCSFQCTANRMCAGTKNIGRGFEIAEKGYCGTDIVELAVICNQLSSVCTEPSSYVFWDSYHPTEGKYKILTTSIIQKYVEAFH